MEVLQKGQYSGVVTGDGCSEAGILATVTTYNQDNFNGAYHYHNNAHISFAIRGACIEKKRISYEQTPGKITYYSAMEPHQVMKVLQSACHINVEIEQSFFDEFNITDAAVDTAINQNPDAKFLMLKIYKELQSADDFSTISIRMLLLELIHHTAKLRTGYVLPAWVKTIHDLLHDRWNEKVTLQELSLIANVHPVTISRYFPRYFSCTLGDYLRKIRVEKALIMMKSSSPVSLSDVAFTCGFADQSHFIRTFKHLTGYLPTSYQKL